ncbi:heat shock cognate 71 kDa protein-like [Styela clava]
MFRESHLTRFRNCVFERQGYMLVDIVTNDQEKRITPSCVAFNDVERLYGAAALQQEFINMDSTIYGFKQFMGRCYENSFDEDKKIPLGYQLINQRGKLSFKVHYRKKDVHFYPEEITAMLLTEVKKMAQKHFREKVTHVVISVPTSFNDAQRLATVHAANIAGFCVMALINAPTAAVISYGLENKVSSCNVLLFDIGSGNLNVAVVNIKEGIFRILATKGYCNFGGDAFDSRVVEHFVEEFNNKFHVDMSDDKRAINRLRRACEKAKRTLSGSKQASVAVDALSDGKDLYSTITRERFEELNESLFQKAIECVKTVLKKAKVAKNRIDEILLVGGSSRTPRLRELLVEFFEKKELNKTINPDEAIARGAAFMAGNIQQRKRFIVQDISSFSVGVKTNNGKMIEIIQANAEMPTKKWSNIKEGFTSPVDLQVYEFEDSSMEDAPVSAIYRFYLPSLEQNLPFEVSIELNQSGILTVLGYQNNKQIHQCYADGKGRLDQESLQFLADRMQVFDRADDEWKERSKAINKFENYIYAVQKSIGQRKYKNAITITEMSVLNDKCNELLEWIESNKDASKELSERRQEELEEIWLTILSRINPMKAEEIRHRKESEQQKKREALNALRESVTLFSRTIKEPGYKENSTEEDKSAIRWLFDTVINWISGNTNADIIVIEEKRKEVESYSGAIFQKITEKLKAQEEEWKRQLEIKAQQLEKKKKDLVKAVGAVNNKMNEVRTWIKKGDKEQMEVQFSEARKMISGNDSNIEEITYKERVIVDWWNIIDLRVKEVQKAEEKRLKEKEEYRLEARGVLKSHLRDLVKLTDESFKNDPHNTKQKVKELNRWIVDHPKADQKAIESKNEELLALLNAMQSQQKKECRRSVRTLDGGAISKLQKCIASISRNIDTIHYASIQNECIMLRKLCEETNEWLRWHPNEPDHNYGLKMTKLNKEWDKVLQKLNEKEKDTSEVSTSFRGKLSWMWNSLTGKESPSRCSTSIESKIDNSRHYRSFLGTEIEKQLPKPRANTSRIEKEKLFKYRSIIETRLLYNFTNKTCLRPEEKRNLEKKNREISNLLSLNANLDPDDYLKKNKELHEIAEPILRRLNIWLYR